MRNIFFGDSITAGYPHGAYAAGYPWLLSAMRGEECVPLAIDGSSTTNLANQVYARTPVAGDRHFIMVGTNDRLQRGSGQGALDLFKASLLAEVYWLAGGKIIGRDAAWTFTGTWGNTWTGLTVGKYATTAGAKAEVTFSGDVLTIGTVLTLDGGSFSVKVDGVSKGSFSCLAPANPATALFSQSFAPGLVRIEGCGAGTHALEITVTSSGTAVCVDWVGTGSNSLPLYLMTVLRCNASVYPNSDAGVAAYNACIQTVVNTAAGDGLSVSLVDVSSRVNPASGDLSSDGVHPSNIGYLNIAGMLNGALG